MKSIINYLIIPPCILGTIEICLEKVQSAEYFQEVFQDLPMKIQTKATGRKTEIFINGKLIAHKSSYGFILDEKQRKLIVRNISEDLKTKGFELETDFDVEIDSIAELRKCKITGRDVTVLNRLISEVQTEIYCNNFRNFGEISSDTLNIVGAEDIQINSLLNGRVLTLEGSRIIAPPKISSGLGYHGITGGNEASIVAIDRLFIKAGREYNLSNCGIQTKNLKISITIPEYIERSSNYIIDSTIQVSGEAKITGGINCIKNSNLIIANSLKCRDITLYLNETSKINCGKNIIVRNGRGIVNEGKITSKKFLAKIESHEFQRLYKDLEGRYLTFTQDKQHEFLRKDLSRTIKESLIENREGELLLGNLANRGDIIAEGKVRIISDGIITNAGEIMSGGCIRLFSQILLENSGRILNTGEHESYATDIVLGSPFGIKNIGGMISSVGPMQLVSKYSYLQNKAQEGINGIVQSASDLSIVAGSDFENTCGSEILSEQDLKVKALAILNEGSYIKGNRIKLLINTNESDEIIETDYINSMSRTYQNYFPDKCDMEYEGDDEIKEHSKEKPDEKDKDSEEASKIQLPETKGVYDAAGTLQNKSKGIIESGEKIEIQASGNIDNIDLSRITTESEKGQLNIVAFGRLINDYGSQISGERLTVKIENGCIWNMNRSAILDSVVNKCLT